MPLPATRDVDAEHGKAVQQEDTLACSKCCMMMSAMGRGALLSALRRCMWPTSFMPPISANPGSSLLGTNLSSAIPFT